MIDWISDWVTAALLAVCGAVTALGGWIMQRLFRRLDDMERELSNHKIYVAQVYVPRQEHREDMQRIMQKLDTIIEKLETKRDK